MYLKNTASQKLWGQRTLHAPPMQKAVVKCLSFYTTELRPFFDAMRLTIKCVEALPADLSAGNGTVASDSHVITSFIGHLLSQLGQTGFALRLIGPRHILALATIFRHYATKLWGLISFWVALSSAGASQVCATFGGKRLALESRFIYSGHVGLGATSMCFRNSLSRLLCVRLPFATTSNIVKLPARRPGDGNKSYFRCTPRIVIGNRGNVPKLKCRFSMSVPRLLQNAVVMSTASKFMDMLPDSLRSAFRVTKVKSLRDSVANAVYPWSFHQKPISFLPDCCAMGVVCI